MNISITVTSALLALGLTLTPTRVRAQEQRPITLSEAVAEAELHGPGVAQASLDADAALQARRLDGAPLLPQIEARFGAVRSNDPVAVFGSRLRQGQFTEQDFDPVRLNDPDPLSDWYSALTVGWSPIDFGQRATTEAADETAAAAAGASVWTRRSAAFVAEARFMEALGADGLLEAAEASFQAAAAHRTLVEDRVEEGLLMDADALRARAAEEAALAARINAERSVSDARSRLGLALGWPASLVPVPEADSAPELDLSGEAVPSSSAVGDTSRADLSLRPDLQASAHGVRAAEARVKSAQRSRLPRLGAFASLGTHAPEAFSGLRGNWTVGLEVSVPLFNGTALSAGQRAAEYGALAAEAAHEERLRSAEVQLQEAQRAAVTASQQAVAAEAASEAASEAMRLMRLRFEEGMATTADLLAAQASAADLASAAVLARLGHRLALARLTYLTTVDTTDLPGGFE